jgi:hypothetical protein
MSDENLPAEVPVDAELNRTTTTDRQAGIEQFPPIIDEVIINKRESEAPSPEAVSICPLYINHCSFLI